MDVLGAILMLLVAFGFFVGVISLIVLVVMAISKKNLKFPGIVTGSAFGVSLLAFIGFIILAVVDPVENTTAESEMPRSSAEANNETPTKPKTSASAGNESEKENEETEYEEEESADLETEELDIENTEEVTEEVDEETPEVDPEDLSNYRTDYDIKDVERNPAEYKDELLSFEGKIIQVMEDDVFTSYRIAINGDYDRIVYLQTFSETLEERLLEDDYVTVYGIFDDLLTYETVLGANQTVPAFIAHGERIVLNQ